MRSKKRKPPKTGRATKHLGRPARKATAPPKQPAATQPETPSKPALPQTIAVQRRRQADLSAEDAFADWPSRSTLLPMLGGGYESDAFQPGAFQGGVSTSSTDQISTTEDPPRQGAAMVPTLPDGGPATESSPISVHPTVYPATPATTVVVTNVITINVHSRGFREAQKTIADVIDAIRGSNEIPPEVRGQLTSEMKAGTEILSAPKVDRTLVDLLLIRPLKYVAEKCASVTVGELAKIALKALLRLIGVDF